MFCQYTNQNTQLISVHAWRLNRQKHGQTTLRMKNLPSLALQQRERGKLNEQQLLMLILLLRLLRKRLLMQRLLLLMLMLMRPPNMRPTRLPAVFLLLLLMRLNVNGRRILSVN